MVKIRYMGLYHACPNCGTAVFYGGKNGNARCPGCKKQVIFQDGIPVGVR